MTAGAPPRRIRLQRTTGWRLPPNAVKVDRSTEWGNPFKIGGPADARLLDVHRWNVAAPTPVPATAANAVAMFEVLLTSEPGPGLIERATTALRGKSLACWCAPDQPCHADVWLRVVNRPLECDAARKIGR